LELLVQVLSATVDIRNVSFPFTTISPPPAQRLKQQACGRKQEGRKGNVKE
jgi:hypothetical protein